MLRTMGAKSVTMFVFCLQCVPAIAQDLDVNKQEILQHSRLTRSVAALEDPARDSIQKPDKVIETLGVKDGFIVADVGAGSGYFTFRLADKVGKSGRVYAVEKEQEYLNYITKKMDITGVKNITPVLSSQSGPGLPPSCCDLLLLVHTYGELYEPVEFMKNARRALRPRGAVAIINGKAGYLYPNHYVPEDKVIIQMASAGYRLVKTYDYLEYQFFLIFEDARNRTSIK